MSAVTEQNASWIVFEQPLNERVRTFLRLEHLFDAHAHHRLDPSAIGKRARLGTILDLLSLIGRSDFKPDLVKELTEQHSALSKLLARSGIDQNRLTSVLAKLDSAITSLNSLTSMFATNALRDNEFLISVLNRSSMAGGTCSFDLPVMHHWIHHSPQQMDRDLECWFADIEPYESGVRLYLDLLRNSTHPTGERAVGGMFMMTPKTAYSMLRVLVPAKQNLFPEISAGRHRFSIRFMTLRDINQHASQAATDVDFRLHCCTL